MGNDCQIKVLNKQLFQRGRVGWRKMEIDNGIKRNNKNILNRILIGIGIILIVFITLLWFASISHTDIDQTNRIGPNLYNIGITLSSILAVFASFSSFVVICCFKVKK